MESIEVIKSVKLICKSCDKSIKSTDSFCLYCGGKIIRERISLKGTWIEFIQPFFSWDNNFRKTFFELFSRPDKVFYSYIDGARKKYFNPFSFLIIYASLSFLLKDYFLLYNFPEFIKGFYQPFGLEEANYDEFFLKVYNVIIIILVPFLALFSYLAFQTKGHNYTEHLVFQAYIQPIIGCLFLLSDFICSMITNVDLYFLPPLIIIFYSNYVFQRFYRLKPLSILVANIKFFGLFFLSVFIIMMTSLMLIISDNNVWQ